MSERTALRQPDAPPESFAPSEDIDNDNPLCLTSLLPKQGADTDVAGIPATDTDPRRVEASVQGAQTGSLETTDTQSDDGGGESGGTPEGTAGDADTCDHTDEGEDAGEGGNGPTFEITEDDFDKYFPKAADELRKHGVTKLKITPDGSGYTIGAELKDDLVKKNPQFEGDDAPHPRKGDVKEMRFDKNISFHVEKREDGSIKLTDIEGIHAKSYQAFNWRNTDLDTITLTEENGMTVINSTGHMGAFSGKGKPREESIEVMNNANKFLERLGEIAGGGGKKGAEAKKAGAGSNQSGFMHIPNIFEAIGLV